MCHPARSSGVELLSYHTVSKGTGGECGLRGGYVEMTNIHPGTIDEIYKCASINLSPNTSGQVRRPACKELRCPDDTIQIKVKSFV